MIEAKFRALLEGAEYQNIDKIINDLSVESWEQRHLQQLRI